LIWYSTGVHNGVLGKCQIWPNPKAKAFIINVFTVKVTSTLCLSANVFGEPNITTNLVAGKNDLDLQQRNHLLLLPVVLGPVGAADVGCSKALRFTNISLFHENPNHSFPYIYILKRSGFTLVVVFNWLKLPISLLIFWKAFGPVLPRAGMTRFHHHCANFRYGNARRSRK